MAKYRFDWRWSEGGYLIENGSEIGQITARREFRKDGRLLTQIEYDNEIRENGRFLAKVVGDEIQDKYSAVIGRISDIRREIDGSDNLDPMLIAGLWITFIKG